jgi:hypothetical protein
VKPRTLHLDPILRFFLFYCYNASAVVAYSVFQSRIHKIFLFSKRVRLPVACCKNLQRWRRNSWSLDWLLTYEIERLSADKVFDGGPADGRDQPIHESALQVRPEPLEPDHCKDATKLWQDLSLQVRNLNKPHKRPRCGISFVSFLI